jgi:malate dehydrogenase (oxaloacetate-decarboxylating)
MLYPHSTVLPGTAFTAEEREAFGLIGRLPHRINSLDEQCQRAIDQLESQSGDLAKNTFLQSLRDQNWVLYYSLISRHLRELIPIIYTPTEVQPKQTLLPMIIDHIS